MSYKIKLIKVVGPNGVEGTMVESAFRDVWEERGFTRVEAEEGETTEEGVAVEPDVTTPGESKVSAKAKAPAAADDQSGGSA